MAECTKNCGRRATRRGLCRNHYEQHRSRQKAYGRWESTYTDAAPVRTHIEALIAAGVGKRRIAALAGVGRNNVLWITNGRPERGCGPSAKVQTRIAEAILAVPIPDITEHRHILADGDLVPAAGTVRRLQALVVVGYTQAFLCERLGIKPRNSTRLFHGQQTFVTVRCARAVAAVFDELHLTPGPSRRARAHAARHGWVPPLAWDEDTIDDPAALPDHGPVQRLDFAARYAELHDDLMLSDAEIARRLGIKFQSLAKMLYRAGLPVSPELNAMANAERSAQQPANSRRAAS